MKDAWQSLHGRVVLGVPVTDWAAFAGVVIGLFLVLRLASRVLRARMVGRDGGLALAPEAYAARLLGSTWTVSLLAASVLASLFLEGLRPTSTIGRGSAGQTLRTLALLNLALQVGRWGSALVDTALGRAFRLARFSETATRTASGVVRFFAMSALWACVAVLVLGTFGVAVTPLLAGLGVGGIAFGFALQRILGDIFCSVAIVLDRPFEVGDLIQAGDLAGTVEQIGVKTTRVRSVDGEQIVFPNSDLLQSRIRNFHRMAERRITFRFGVKSTTRVSTLERIPSIVHAIIDGVEATRFDRAHLKAIGESSHTFEVAYHVLGRDEALAMDIQQRVNLELLRALEGLDAPPVSVG